MKLFALLSICLHCGLGFCVEQNVQNDSNQKDLPSATVAQSMFMGSQDGEEEELIGFEEDFEEDDNNFEVAE